MTNKKTSRIQRHANYSSVDYDYLSEKGYSDNEILAIWDRDASLGKTAIKYFTKPFDIVGYLN